MARILCTFPGRYGDLLWALPTVRAISEAAGEPVDLHIAGEFGSLIDLVETAPYIGHVGCDQQWTLTPPAEWNPPYVPRGYDDVLHLGYRGWPDQPLAQSIYAQVQREYPAVALGPLDLGRPWLTMGERRWPDERPRLVYGFTEEWFELKYGLFALLQRYRDYRGLNLSTSGRWTTELDNHAWSWEMAARRTEGATLFVGCCSAPHVLAVALGTPVVVVEPSEARQNPIFYPVGMDGPQVTIVRGGDGKPTFHAPHVYETIDAVLARQPGRKAASQ